MESFPLLFHYTHICGVDYTLRERYGHYTLATTIVWIGFSAGSVGWPADILTCFIDWYGDSGTNYYYCYLHVLLDLSVRYFENIQRNK